MQLPPQVRAASYYTTYTYVAVTKDRKRFTTYTERQISEYTKTAIYRICKAAQSTEEINKNQLCKMQLFKAPEVVPTKCVVEKFTLHRNIHYRFQNKNTWIHVGVNTLKQ